MPRGVADRGSLCLCILLVRTEGAAAAASTTGTPPGHEVRTEGAAAEAAAAASTTGTPPGHEVRTDGANGTTSFGYNIQYFN